MTVFSIGCKPSLPPTTSSHRDKRKSAFMESGLSPAVILSSTSIGFKWWGLSGEISITWAWSPSLRASGTYSPIGSTITMRSFVARNTFKSSLFAAKDFPEPVEPRYKPLADFSFLRSAMMTLWERAFMP